MQEQRKRHQAEQGTGGALELDAVDLRLLEHLQRDAGLTNQALAERVHVSPATCLRRVRRLEAQGVILRRVALLDGAKLNACLTAIVEVSLDRQGAEHLDRFAGRCAVHPAVRQCYRVAPGPDFVLVMQAADMQAWGRIVDALFTQDANVRNLKCYFVTRREVFDTVEQLPG